MILKTCTQRAGEREGDDWPGLEAKAAGAPLSAKAARAAKPVGDLDLLAAFALEDGDEPAPEDPAEGLSGEGLGEGPADPDAAPASVPAAAQPPAEAPPNGSAEGLADTGASSLAAGDAAQEGAALQQPLGGEAQAEAHAGGGNAAAGSEAGADAGDAEPAAKRQRTEEPILAVAPGEAGTEPGALPGDAAGEGLGDGVAAGGPPRERGGSPAGPSGSFHSTLSTGATPPAGACRPPRSSSRLSCGAGSQAANLMPLNAH